jgi:hypothetical protein
VCKAYFRGFAIDNIFRQVRQFLFWIHLREILQIAFAAQVSVDRSHSRYAVYGSRMVVLRSRLVHAAACERLMAAVAVPGFVWAAGVAPLHAVWLIIVDSGQRFSPLSCCCGSAASPRFGVS